MAGEHCRAVKRRPISSRLGPESVIGVGEMSAELDAARINMVDCQVRTQDVTDYAIIDAMRLVGPRGLRSEGEGPSGLLPTPRWSTHRADGCCGPGMWASCCRPCVPAPRKGPGDRRALCRRRAGDDRPHRHPASRRRSLGSAAGGGGLRCHRLRRRGRPRAGFGGRRPWPSADGWAWWSATVRSATPCSICDRPPRSARAACSIRCPRSWRDSSRARLRPLGRSRLVMRGSLGL